MAFSTHDQLVLLALLTGLAALLILAPALRIPYPIFLVLGGLGLGFVPGIPALVLPPQVVFVAVLPPLIYLSAFFTSVRDLRANARSIGILAVGLVVAVRHGRSRRGRPDGQQQHGRLHRQRHSRQRPAVPLRLGLQRQPARPGGLLLPQVRLLQGGRP